MVQALWDRCVIVPATFRSFIACWREVSRAAMQRHTIGNQRASVGARLVAYLAVARKLYSILWHGKSRGSQPGTARNVVFPMILAERH